VVELSDNHVLVIKLNTHKPIELKPLDLVSEEIDFLLSKEKVTKALTQQANELLALLAAGSSVETVAANAQLEWQVAADVKRGAPQVDRQLLSQMFELAKPVATQPINSVQVLDSGDVVVAQLTVVKAGSLPEMEDAQKRALTQRFAQELANGELAIYQSSLNDNAAVDIY